MTTEVDRRLLASMLELLPSQLDRVPDPCDLECVVPWFYKSFDTPGDICDFGSDGCGLAIKLAYVLRALGLAKTVYTFIGAKQPGPEDDVAADPFNTDYSDDIARLGRVLPLRRITGDFGDTSKLLAGRLSLVWFNVGSGYDFFSVLDSIEPLFSIDAFIGLYNLDHDQHGGINPALDQLVSDGRLIELRRYPRERVRVYRLRPQTKM